MNRLLLIGALTLTFAGCALVPHRTEKNPYEQPFYAKYLNPESSALDARIESTLEGLQANPNAATLHNELGGLLIQKGFPKDAQREFERAIDIDRRFYPAWYNLGLARAANGDEGGAETAFRRTVRYKPGHAAALFQLGLIEEKSHNAEAAIRYYAKAIKHNPAMIDPRVNPQIVDSKLVHRALIELYPEQHAKQAMQFQPAPAGYVDREVEAPSPQPKPEDIITPAPPATDPSMQPKPPAQPQTPPQSSAVRSRSTSDIRRSSRPADQPSSAAFVPPPPEPLTLLPNASAPQQVAN